MQYAEDFHATPPHRLGETMLGGADLPASPDHGEVSAMVKRLVNARSLDLSLRSSHRNVDCPGLQDDGEATCGRYCAAEHLTLLRAFTVTGAHLQSPPPDPPPPDPAPGGPPLPPSAPFTECSNTCRELGGELHPDDFECRDGGKGSRLPTLCAYGTNCDACGFRENTEAIEQDDSCATRANGVCEDGGAGSGFILETEYAYGGRTSLCGFGQDKTDCAGLGARTTQPLTAESFQGVTSFSRPTPPPPPPPSPAPSPPPPGSFESCGKTCSAFFKVETAPGLPNAYSFDCSGTADQIAHKRAKGECPSDGPEITGTVDLCSDGGFGARPVEWTGNELGDGEGATRFACDYGSQCGACSPRVRVATTDEGCVRSGDNLGGACRDSCWVDRSNDDKGVPHNTEEQYDAAATNADGSSNVNTLCHDGGPGSSSAKCPFGSQSTRCGPSRTITYTSPFHCGYEAYPCGDATTRRRLLFGGTMQSRDVAVPPPPPPKPPPPRPPPNAAVEAVFGTEPFAADVPPPTPPAPPPPPPPRPPPPLPPPPLAPNSFDTCACSCFTEDSVRNEGTNQAGWADIAVRARATSVVPSAVLYRAHAVLTRGRRLHADGAVWVVGQGNKVGRYIHSDACAAQIAHLVAGWKQDRTAAAAMLLSSNPLTAYMGHQPWWWSVLSHGSDYNARLPDAAQGPAAIAFWRDVCASLCHRKHDDDVEVIEVDLRRGLSRGGEADGLSTCDCYAYDDLGKLGVPNAASTPSHAAPNDILMAQFLKTASLVENYESETPGVDFGLRYRQYVNTYAVHRDDWSELFVDTQQSTVFYAKALESGYGPAYDALQADAGLYVGPVIVADLNACLRECALHGGGGGAAALEARMNAASMVFTSRDGSCWCSTTNWLDPARDGDLAHFPGHRELTVYRIKFCLGVAGGSSRSLVYRKGVSGAAAVCAGMPVGAGMILANGSFFVSRDAGDYNVPVDAQCNAACDANPECGMAHSVRKLRR